MNAYERRRVALASIVTVVALPALWVLNRDDAAPDATAAVGGTAPIGADSAPSTSEYVPEPPAFVGGEEEPVRPGVVDVAVPPAPNPNEVDARASYSNYGSTARPCTTLLAPDGALLTVMNVDNGQSTTCTNTYGKVIPSGADMVLDTAIYNEIGDLADAPIPVRINW